jgi:hypothetical protein
MASSTTSSAPLRCQVVLTLAHLLHQQSPRYDIEKHALLSASAQCALQATQRQQQQQQQRNTIDSGGSGGGEVHLFLTGSPRPTFAETNAWLLESYRNNHSPAKMKSQRNKDCRDDSAAAAAADDDKNGNNHNNTMNEKNNNNNREPLVGHAVVNAISQTSGVGLKCIRSKMLQGTIDRPEWDQTRWTDGECLFSELVGRVGLESFEGGSGAGSGTSMVGGKKATNLSANLITVSAFASSVGDGGGMGEETFEEIARNILRCLRRRRDSPPASVIHVLLPPDELDDGGNNSASRSTLASSRLMEAFHKLEKYNDMIGVPRLMADATLEVVSTFAS